VTTAAAAGLLTGLSLIIAIGAQNAFVLRQGLARQYVGPVVAVCAVSDAVLIVAGVTGIGTIVEHAEWVLELVRWLGVVFLATYGVLSLLRARRPDTLEAARAGVASRRAAVGRALALTYLNPHVYLDTVLLLGSIANQHGDVGRWWFAAGAAAGSVLWFTGLGYGAGAGQRLLATPRAWQVLDVVIGLTMLAIALSLAVG
jgi:L-lysine exporter family protein LysE/ArgO